MIIWHIKKGTPILPVFRKTTGVKWEDSLLRAHPQGHGTEYFPCDRDWSFYDTDIVKEPPSSYDKRKLIRLNSLEAFWVAEEHMQKILYTL